MSEKKIRKNMKENRKPTLNIEIQRKMKKKKQKKN